jgi:hypothetical protein
MIAGNYTFNKMTNINDDSCALTQNNIENSQAETYMLNNFFPSCPMNSAIDFATQQPFVFYNGSHQVGINGCNIAENSELLHTSISRPPCRINLLQRPFATVPFLGKGRHNVNLESVLREGELIQNNHKSANPSSEVCYINYSNYPLLPEVKNSLADGSNQIESDKSIGWVRGGLPSREFARDQCNISS